METNDSLLVYLLAEGGGIRVFGHKKPNGSWSFLAHSTSLELDDDGNETVRVAGVPRCSDLADALPDRWFLFQPWTVHPELVSWFRENYEAAVTQWPPYRRGVGGRLRDGRWRALFANPSSRWHEDDGMCSPAS
jgi:hypothetical protein